MNWQDAVELNENEKIVLGRKIEKGNLGQEEIREFDIVDEKNNIVGKGKYVEHLNVRGLDQSSHVIYTRNGGDQIIKKLS